MFNSIFSIIIILSQFLNIGYPISDSEDEPKKVFDYQINQTNPEELLDYSFNFENNPFSIIVSHHLFAKHLIGSTFKAVDFQPERIIILGPNHFQRGKSGILFTDKDWIFQDTKKIKVDKMAVKYLVYSGSGKVENSVFEKEHSIYTLYPFINYYFPDAKILPIIFRYQITDEELKKLLQSLTKIIDAKTLVVVSADFSHEAIPEIAVQRDKKTIEVLENSDIERIDEIEVDTKPAIKTLLYLQKIKNINKFQLLKNTNSGYLSGKPDLADATSYIFAGYLH